MACLLGAGVDIWGGLGDDSTGAGAGNCSGADGGVGVGTAVRGGG